MNETDAKLQFGKVLRWWFGLQELQNHPRTFMVLCILATYADGTSGVIPRKSSPSRNTLAALAGVPPRNISLHLRLLEILELITVERSNGRKSQYTVALSPKTSVSHNTALAKVAVKTSVSHGTGTGIATDTGFQKAVLPQTPHIIPNGQTLSDHHGDASKEEPDEAIISRLVSLGYDDLQARKATKKNRPLAVLWSRINPADYSWAKDVGSVIGANIRDGIPPPKKTALKSGGQDLAVVDLLDVAWDTITTHCEILQSKDEWCRRNRSAAVDLLDIGKSVKLVKEMLEAALESEFYANTTTLEALKRNWAQIDSLREKIQAKRYMNGDFLRIA